APIHPIVPQEAHASRAPLTSIAKTSRRNPAAALPSSRRCLSSISLASGSLASSRSEPLGLHAIRRPAELDQRLGDRLDQRSGTANETKGALLRSPPHLGKHPQIDSPRVPRPAGRPL